MTLPIFTCLTIAIEGDVATLTLTRAHRLNAFDEDLHREFAQALEQIAGRSDLRVLIVAAEGTAFSAGGDLTMIRRANASQVLRDRLADEARTIFTVLTSLPIPVIAAVQGAAIGLGATVVSLADIVVAARSVVLSDPHVQIGLTAGDGGVIGWSQAIGLNRAKRFLLTGDRLRAEQAYALGLVTDLVDQPEDVAPTAQAIARNIASLPPGGVQGTKRAFNRLSKDFAWPAFEQSLAAEMATLQSEDVLRAVAAAEATARTPR